MLFNVFFYIIIHFTANSLYRHQFQSFHTIFSELLLIAMVTKKVVATYFGYNIISLVFLLMKIVVPFNIFLIKSSTKNVVYISRRNGFVSLALLWRSSFALVLQIRSDAKSHFRRLIYKSLQNGHNKVEY